MALIIIVGLVLVIGLSWVMKVAIAKDRAEEEQLTSEQIPEEPVPLPTKPATIKKPHAKKVKTPKKGK